MSLLIQHDKNTLRKQIENYMPFCEQEECDKKQMLSFFDTFPDVVTRDNIFGHMSASAFVVSPDYNQTLLVKHNIFGGLIYPGGHADGEYDLLKVALREVAEETGLDVLPITEEIFAIQSCSVLGHIKKGKYISAHTHFDILYLVMAKIEEMDKIRNLPTENSSVGWYDLDYSYGPSAVPFIRPVTEKIVRKVRSLKIK